MKGSSKGRSACASSDAHVSSWKDHREYNSSVAHAQSIGLKPFMVFGPDVLASRLLEKSRPIQQSCLDIGWFMLQMGWLPWMKACMIKDVFGMRQYWVNIFKPQTNKYNG